MTAYRSDDLIFDAETLAAALKAPLPPRLNVNTLRPPGTPYTLEDRLPGVMGSVAPPSRSALRAMTATCPEKRSPRIGFALAVVLVLLTVVTAAVVYRDMSRARATTTVGEPS